MIYILIVAPGYLFLPLTLPGTHKTSKYKVAGSAVFMYHYTNTAKNLNH